MMRKICAISVMSGMLSLFCLSLPGYTQTPYWDNSSDSGQSFYTPYNQGSGSGSGSGYDSNQNSYGNQNNYGNQPGYNSGQMYNSNPNGYGQYNYNQQPALKGYVSTAPVGTSLSVTTAAYISSEFARIGDPVSVALGYDLSMGGNVILPAGTQVQGEVVSSIPAGRTGRHGQLQLRFNRAMLPDGRQVPLSARLVTEDGTGIIYGGTRGERVGQVAKNTIGGAALGAASGALLGLIKGHGKADDYLARGAVIGGGLGAGRSIIQRGEEAEITPGTQLQIMLDQPLTITSGSGQNSPYGGGGYPY